mmetsp:Transcript_100607/g.285027  ORF Transcript_100607/g.285027 Transcript_100607/m.285027 type:complete len:235 (+) Transcript_100607:238-942(+)
MDIQTSRCCARSSARSTAAARPLAMPTENVRSKSVESPGRSSSGASMSRRRQTPSASVASSSERRCGAQLSTLGRPPQAQEQPQTGESWVQFITFSASQTTGRSGRAQVALQAAKQRTTRQLAMSTRALQSFRACPCINAARKKRKAGQSGPTSGPGVRLAHTLRQSPSSAAALRTGAPTRAAAPEKQPRQAPIAKTRRAQVRSSRRGARTAAIARRRMPGPAPAGRRSGGRCR